MTTAVAPTGPARPAVESRDRALRRAVGSEWTKLTTVRSTPIVALVGVVLTAGFAALAAGIYSHRIAGMSAAHRAATLARDEFDPVSFCLVGIALAQVAFGVLGVLAISSEYGSGSIRTTLTAVPDRRRLILAKVLAFGALALVAGQVAAFVAYGIGQAFFARQSLAISLGGDGVLRAVAGSGLYLALIGLLGLGIGCLVRHTAGAITILISLVLVIGPVASALPGRWGERVHRFMPDSIGQRIGELHTHNDALAPITGIALLAVYVVVLLVAGTLLMRHRDA